KSFSHTLTGGIEGILSRPLPNAKSLCPAAFNVASLLKGPRRSRLAQNEASRDRQLASAQHTRFPTVTFSPKNDFACPLNVIALNGPKCLSWVQCSRRLALTERGVVGIAVSWRPVFSSRIWGLAAPTTRSSAKPSPVRRSPSGHSPQGPRLPQRKRRT